MQLYLLHVPSAGDTTKTQGGEPVDLFESNLDRTCAYCGTELGFRRYKPQAGSSKRFCTIAHLEAWIRAREAQKASQQQQTFAVVMGGKA